MTNGVSYWASRNISNKHYMRFFGKPSRANFCKAFMPDSEQIEAFGTEFLCRNSVSVEEIQDRCENRKFIIGKSIFSIWIWVYPFNARRSRLRPLNDEWVFWITSVITFPRNDVNLSMLVIYIELPYVVVSGVISFPELSK